MYFGMFSVNELRRLPQILSAINMFYLTYQMYTNSEETFLHDGFSLLTSMLNFYALGDNRDFLTELSSWIMSSGDSCNILYSISKRSSEIQIIVNLWQALLINPYSIGTGMTTQDEETTLKMA